MHPFWRTNLGKIIIGGCGTQVGMLLAFGSVIIIALFCVICASASALSLGVTQEIVRQPTLTPTATVVPIAVSSSGEVELLRVKVSILADRLESLAASTPVAQPPTATPLPTPTPTPTPTPNPMLTAHESGVNLRGGPGIEYNKIGLLPKGDSLEIVGRNEGSSWWLVTTPEGSLAWAADMVVATFYINDSIPVVTIPALLVQAEPDVDGEEVAASMVIPSAATTTTRLPELGLSPGTPINAADEHRIYVQDTKGYKQLVRHLLLPTVSESFSPNGDQIAITERIRLYTIASDGSSSRVLLEDAEDINLIGGAVWSPTAEYIAFVADQTLVCGPCRVVGLARLADGSISYLDPPWARASLDMPRWTQDGRLLVNVYLDEPANGTVYEVSGQGQEASGSFDLSSSHDGQKWFPWRLGKTWEAGSSERADSYYID
jgi:hypothetical protein